MLRGTLLHWVADFSRTVIFRGFSLYIINLAGQAIEKKWARGGGRSASFENMPGM
jgi:hypothetical protein